MRLTVCQSIRLENQIIHLKKSKKIKTSSNELKLFFLGVKIIKKILGYF